MNTAMKLRKIASMLKNTLSSAERLSVLYILKLAGYEDEWRKEIENLAKNAPKHFESVFQGKNRIYLPFGRKTMLSEQDENILDFLHANNFNVPTNDMYIDGYAESKQYPGRLIRIGKIFDNLKREQETILNDIAELREDSSYVPKIKEKSLLHIFDQYKNYEHEYDFEISDIKNAAERRLNKLSALSENFRTSPARQKKGVKDYQIVISQDPHDVAKMSYERSWKSCRTLKSESDEGEDYGAYCSSTLDDVRSGGMVAYLIEASDINIENPIARIAIRKFEDDEGKISARMESTVYGINVEGFKDDVRQFLDANFPKPKAGYATMLGGRQTDTFDMVLRGRDRGFIFVENIQDLNNMIAKEIESLSLNERFINEIRQSLSEHTRKQMRSNALMDIILMIDQNIDKDEYLKRYKSSIEKASVSLIHSKIPKIINVINKASSLTWTDKEKIAHKKIVLVEAIANILIDMPILNMNNTLIQDMERVIQIIPKDTWWQFINFPNQNNAPERPDKIIKSIDSILSKSISIPIENFFDKFIQIRSQVQELNDYSNNQNTEIVESLIKAFANPSDNLAKYIIATCGIYATDCLSIIEQVMPKSRNADYYKQMKSFIDDILKEDPHNLGEIEIVKLLALHNFPQDAIPTAAKDILSIMKNSIRVTQAPSLLAAREFIKYQSEGSQKPLQER